MMTKLAPSRSVLLRTVYVRFLAVNNISDMVRLTEKMVCMVGGLRASGKLCGHIAVVIKDWVRMMAENYETWARIVGRNG